MKRNVYSVPACMSWPGSYQKLFPQMSVNMFSLFIGLLPSAGLSEVDKASMF